MTANAQALTAQEDGRLRQAQLKMLGMLQVIDAICQKHHLDYWLEGGTLLGDIRHQGFIPWDDDLDISMPRASFEAFLRLAPQELPDHVWLQTAKTDPGFYNLATPMKIRDKDSLFIEIHEKGDEPYQQGIFIDIFVYDTLPQDAKQRRKDKFKAKKILRLLSSKFSPIPMGHYAGLYKFLGKFFSKHTLEKKLHKIIAHANQSTSHYLGYGYDCVNSNLVKREDIYPLGKTVFEGISFNIPHKAEVILTQLYSNYMQLPDPKDRIMKHCKQLIPYLSQQTT